MEWGLHSAGAGALWGVGSGQMGRVTGGRPAARAPNNDQEAPRHHPTGGRGAGRAQCRGADTGPSSAAPADARPAPPARCRAAGLEVGRNGRGGAAAGRRSGARRARKRTTHGCERAFGACVQGASRTLRRGHAAAAVREPAPPALSPSWPPSHSWRADWPGFYCFRPSLLTTHGTHTHAHTGTGCAGAGARARAHTHTGGAERRDTVQGLFGGGGGRRGRACTRARARSPRPSTCMGRRPHGQPGGPCGRRFKAAGAPFAHRGVGWGLKKVRRLGLAATRDAHAQPRARADAICARSRERLGWGWLGYTHTHTHSTAGGGRSARRCRAVSRRPVSSLFQNCRLGAGAAFGPRPQAAPGAAAARAPGPRPLAGLGAAARARAPSSFALRRPSRSGGVLRGLLLAVGQVAGDVARRAEDPGVGGRGARVGARQRVRLVVVRLCVPVGRGGGGCGVCEWGGGWARARWLARWGSRGRARRHRARRARARTRSPAAAAARPAPPRAGPRAHHIAQLGRSSARAARARRAAAAARPRRRATGRARATPRAAARAGARRRGRRRRGAR